MNLTKRIERLESLVPQEAESLTIVHTLVAADNGKPAVVQPEVTYARTCSDDWRLGRNPGEPLDVFTRRATALVPRNEWGVTSIILDSDESSASHSVDI